MLTIFAAAAAAIMTFGAFLKRLKSVKVGTEKSFNVTKDLLQNGGTKIGKIDALLRKMEVTQLENGLTKIGDEFPGGLHRIGKSADLEGLARLAKSSEKFSKAEISAFEESLGDVTSEIDLRKMTNNVKETRVQKPELDVNAKDLDNPKNLSSKTKDALSKSDSAMSRYFKKGVPIILTVGVVAYGTDWLSKAVKARPGCYMLRRINGKTTSCKLSGHTCMEESKNIGGPCADSDAPAGLYNVTLVLIYVATRISNPNENELAKIIAKAAGIEPNEISSKLKYIIDSKFSDVTDALSKNIELLPKKIDLCSLKHPSVEEGTVPPCRLCSPTAAPTSTQFVDMSQYADNITFQCVETATAIDVLSDIATTTGKNIFGAVTWFSGKIKTIAIVVGVIFTVIIFIYLLFNFVLPLTRRRHNVGNYVRLD